VSDEKPRQIRLPIAPATDATCGDGRGNFCPFVRTAAFGTRWECLIWGSLEDTGWLMRHPKCLDAEKSKEYEEIQRLRSILACIEVILLSRERYPDWRVGAATDLVVSAVRDAIREGGGVIPTPKAR
jgi:hypothetical protein